MAVIAPACAGRSISSPEDDKTPTVPGDDDYPGQGGSSGASSGGAGTAGDFGGAATNGGAFITGGSFPTGGTYPTGGTFPTGGVGTSGGSIAVGGTFAGGTAGVIATGGTSPCAGDRIGGGGFAGQAPPNTDPECKGIRTNQPCALDGKMCPNLPCGLADSGRRQCSCATNWQCTSCDNSNSWISTPPCDILPCPPEVADEVSCTSEHTVCGPVGSEYCACYRSPTDGLIWDCDSPPSSWPQL
jgi:hypothetical protein